MTIGEAMWATAIFTVVAEIAPKDDGNIHGHWSIPMVFNEGRYESLFWLVLDALLSAWSSTCANEY